MDKPGKASVPWPGHLQLAGSTQEQAGFRQGWSMVDQVTLLTQDIDDSFQRKQKAGVVSLDLAAAYDTAWYHGLHVKLLKTIPDQHMVKFLMEMWPNRSFTLKTGDGQCSRLKRLRNGVPQGSVLTPVLFNIHPRSTGDNIPEIRLCR